MPGFVPPPYPHDRLDDLRAVAEGGGGLLDLSVGNPNDPLPGLVTDAVTRSLDRGVGYPASAGFAEYREAAAGWMRRRLGVTFDPEHVVACVGTKEVVAGLPRWLSLRDPDRDTVLYPMVAYPTYAMGAQLAGLRAVPVPLDDAWLPDLDRVDGADAERALVLWLNEPGNPTGSVASNEWYAGAAAWARDRGIVVASDECYAEFVFDGEPTTALSAGPQGVLAVHSLSKRSNMAGMRAGFVVGDPDLVRYLGELRKHAGFMVPGPVQVAAAAAWDDDAHVTEQRERYRARREIVLAHLGGTGLVHDGGPATFYLWLRQEGVDDGWDVAGELVKAGVLAAPGDFYGEAAADHVRVALVAPLDVLDAAFSRVNAHLTGG